MHPTALWFERSYVLLHVCVHHGAASSPQVTVHPTALVYERSYVSLFSRLKADGSASVTAAVTTNIELDAHGWTSVGFALRTGGGVNRRRCEVAGSA
jgi:hypothetical protein